MRKTHPTHHMMMVKPILGVTPKGRARYGLPIPLGIVTSVWIQGGALAPPAGRITLLGHEYKVTHTYTVYQEEYPARPDVVFTVTISPVFHTHPCAEYWQQMTTGTRDWLHPHTCKECTRCFTGWEAWGENGHCCGHWSDREHLAGGLRHMARKRWATSDGLTMGYRFRAGEAICYEGTPNTVEVSK